MKQAGANLIDQSSLIGVKWTPKSALTFIDQVNMDSVIDSFTYGCIAKRIQSWGNFKDRIFFINQDN
jgi:hypothetical protein